MHRYRFLTNTFLVVMLCTSVYSDDANDDSWLTSPDPEKRWRGERDLLGKLDSYVNTAITVIEGEGSQELKPNDIRLTAIDILGALRAKRSVNVLVRIVDYREALPVLSSNGEITPAVYYPAAKALLEIGKPVIPACLEALEKSDARRMEILCWIIKKVEGKEIAELLLEKRLKSCSPNTKSNIQAALDYIKSDARWKYRGQSTQVPAQGGGG